MNDTARGLGDNRPPPDPIGRADELVANANRWVAERPEISDAEMAGTAQEFIRQLRENRDDLDAAAKAEREPLDLAVALIRIRYRKPLELIGIAYTRMQAKLAPWLKREQDRLDAAAAERKRAAEALAAAAEAALRDAEASGTIEAELAARDAVKAKALADKAAARPVERARAKGDMGVRAMTMRTTYFAVVIDEGAALKSFARSPSVVVAGRVAMLEEATRLSTNLAKACKGDASRCPAGFEFRRRETPV